MTVTAIRTVRRLDETSETKEVYGIRIDKGVPIPSRQPTGRVDAALLALEVGESFVHTARVGTRLKVRDKRFTQRRLPDGRYRIWRTK